jgi:hypothetical protein
MALGTSTFSNIGGAVSDLFQASAFKTKAAGQRIESEEFQLAAGLSDQNAAFTEQSTAIQQSQADRAIEKTIGGQQTAVAASGFAAGGSALDLLRDSANQGALQKAVLGQQGLITEAGYKEQAASYRLLSSASDLAASAADKAAGNATTSAYIKFATAGASLLF